METHLALITSLDPPQATEIRRKPDKKHYRYWGETFYGARLFLDKKAYKAAMQDYELSRIPLDIENAEMYDGYSLIVDVFRRTKLRNSLVILNQTVRVVRTGKDKCKIVKI